MNKQFNSSKTQYGKNIARLESCDDDIYFNESYIVICDNAKVKSIHASYDLTIYGSIEANIIDVHGDLNIIGNVICKKMTVKKVLCSGNIKAVDLMCDDEIMADTVHIVDADLTGNLLVNKTMTITGKFNSIRNVLVGEGVVAADDYKADATAVIDYFDVDCKDDLNYIEMMDGFKHDVPNNTDVNLPFDKRIEKITSDFNASLTEAEDEDDIVKKINEIGKVQGDSYKNVHYVLKKIIDISYVDEIETLNQYLYISYGKKYFPKVLLEYETIEPVFSSYLENVEIESLKCVPEDMEDLSFMIYINHDIFSDNEGIYEKIFSSLGLKYSFVKQRLFPSEDTYSDLVEDAEIDETPSKKEIKESEPQDPNIGRVVECKGFGQGIITGVGTSYYVIEFSGWGEKKIGKQFVVFK